MHHWSFVTLSLELLHLEISPEDPLEGSGVTTFDIGSGSRFSQTLGGEVQRLSLFSSWQTHLSLHLGPALFSHLDSKYFFTYVTIPSQTTAIPFKRLSPEELVTRREKDLCFNCNEKFHKGHKCVSKVFLLIAEEDDDSQEAHGLMDPLLDSQEALASSQAQISLHTLSGHLAPKTL